MKIICGCCKVLIGEQEPFEDASEKLAKCVKCIEIEKKQKEQDERRERARMFSGKEITFENGLKGIISIAGKDTQKLSLWDLEVDGKKFACVKEKKDEFQKYLNSIVGPEVDVMFHHSAEIKVPTYWKDKKRKRGLEIKQDEKPQNIDYNCTIRVPKECVMPMFNNVAERADQVAKVMADMIWKQYLKDKENGVVEARLKEMSTSLPSDKDNT